MEKKQTAVEWLEERFQKYTDWIEGDAKATEYTLTQLCNDFAKAKEMEKEQMIDAHYEGQCDNSEGYPKYIAQQYYKETYNK